MKERKEKQGMPVADRNRQLILEYLSDPENPFIRRRFYSTQLLGYKNEAQVYSSLTPEELTAIEQEALENRKARSARQRSDVLEALYKRAMGYSHKAVDIKVVNGEIVETEYIKHYPPDRAAAEEFFNRIEGKTPDRIDHASTDGSMSPNRELTQAEIEQEMKRRGIPLPEND